MKKTIIASLVAVVMMMAGTAWSLDSVEGEKLTGKHFTLNIIAVQNPKTADMDSNQGSGGTIFVNMEGKSQINLICSDEVDAVADDECAVLDKNATDNDGALLALPPTGLLPYNVTTEEGQTEDGTTSDYSLYARPLGKPGGWASITTCAQLLDTDFAGLLSGKFVSILNKTCEWDDAWASVQQVGQDITFRDKGKTSFTNVTAELLTIVYKVEVETENIIGYDDDENPIYERVTEYVRVPIFDPLLEGEYWEFEQGVDEDGNPTPLKHLQIRIYPWGTDVSEDDGNWNNEV